MFTDDLLNGAVGSAAAVNGTRIRPLVRSKAEMMSIRSFADFNGTPGGDWRLVGAFTVTIRARFLIDTTNTGWILYPAKTGLPLLGHQWVLFMATDDFSTKSGLAKLISPK